MTVELLSYILEGSVSEHDSIEGQCSGDGLLLNKLYEGETCRLSLVSGHSHKLYVSHLLEELQQLLCSGGLRTERSAQLKDDESAATECKAPIPPALLAFSTVAVISLYSLELDFILQSSNDIL